MGLIFRQLFDKESSTFTYLLGDTDSREAILIDPVSEQAERDLKLLSELGLDLIYIFETHVHADHITSAAELSATTSAKTVVSAHAQVQGADLYARDGDKFLFGPHELRVLETPGHTDSCLSFVVGDKVFTGDALLIRKTGRTDFQGGSAKKLHQSVTRKLYGLSDETKVYPAHDYAGFSESTIGEEKKFNARIAEGVTEAAFVKTMSELKLNMPKKIDTAVPANLVCGKSA